MNGSETHEDVSVLRGRANLPMLLIWSLCLILSIAIVLTLGVASADSRKGAEYATTSVIAEGIASDLPQAGSQTVRVTLFLADNSVADAFEANRAALSGRLPGAAAARRAATKNPYEKSAQETRIGAMMDDQRNAALPAIRQAAASGTRQSERVAEAVEELGGKVVDGSPFPNTLTVEVPARAIGSLNARPDISAIVRSEAPIWASSPVDGSQLWHDNEFTGAGASADGKGGPDYVAFDQGMRVSHAAFKTRLGTDCSTCVASGPSRVISPPGRTFFSGSKHGNAIGAAVAATDLTNEPTGGAPWPINWQTNKGQAYGLDKLYDTYEAENAYRWWLGVTYNGEAGVTDLPEAVNFSAGIVNDNIDHEPTYSPVDATVSQFGITYTVAAGNCGIADPGFTGCGDGPHRVSIPASNYNVITVGGLDLHNEPYNSSDWTVWANSSPGPTWGGRKKPDLVATPGPAAGTPSAIDDTAYTSGGTGTSNSAPQAASGAILLASVGVYAPTAQKSILINSATPVQGQTYWSPLTGWGALDLAGAFTGRMNYRDGQVSEVGVNGTRFYRQTGVTSGDRTTLVWNRRLGNYTGNNAPPYNTLTNLDLIQIDPSSGAVTATGGSDSADAVDKNQTVSPQNPMPGNGSDAEDNVEQVRSTASGTQVFKVKAMSTIDGASEEPFSIAGSHAITALETPIPEVTLTASPAIAARGQTITVTAQVENPSSDLSLSSASVTLGALPDGVTLESGSQNQPLGTIGADGNATASWEVSGDRTAVNSLSANAAGTTYGESFGGSDSSSFSVDTDAPAVSLSGPSTWSTSASPAFSWSAIDASGVASYDVEVSRSGAPFTPLLAATTSTQAAVSGAEGETIAVRVRARDLLGNTSPWSTPASTTIDEIPPIAAIGGEGFPAKNSLIVPVAASNVGSPITASYNFGSGITPFAGGATAAFTNYASREAGRTLSVSVTDALGRTATAVRSYRIPTLWHSARLKIKRPKVRGGKLTLRGAISRSYRGRVTVRIRRSGRIGTKRVTKRVRVRRGSYKLVVRLKRGKYKVTVANQSGRYLLSARATKTLRVR